MILNIKSLIALLICFSCFLSCTKDSDTLVDVQDNLPEVKEKIYATFNGLVLDQMNQSIQEALVTIDEKSSITDENGYFSISGFFDPDGSHLKAMKDGYFDASGILIPYADVPVNTKVKLIEKLNPVQEESNKSIQLNTEQAVIKFKENAYTFNGNAYEGKVEVVGTSIAIIDAEYSLFSPGSMETIREGRYQILLPYGRVNVELQTDGGEKLDISSAAEITFEIDESLVMQAPTEIPMWYLDSNTGRWVEEGVAIKSGSQYIGEVSHFTEWCVADYSNFYSISGKVTRNGVPYANADIGFSVYSYRFNTSSAEDGSYQLRVYDNETFVLDIVDQCNVEIYQNSFDLVNEDLTFDIDVPASSNSFMVSGQIFCESEENQVNDGYVLINFDNNQFSELVSTDELGGFTFLYDDCNNQNVTVRGFDPIENKQSTPISLTGTTEALKIDVCKEEISGSIRIEQDGEEAYVIAGCTVQISEFGNLPGYQYIFTARDDFNSLTDVSGEYIDYEILVNVSIPGEIRLPYGPISSPLDRENGKSENAPFFYEVVPAGVTILSESDETVVIKTNDMFPIRKIAGSTITELNGQIILEGVKL